MCFDPNLRCDVECNYYKLNFTGETDGCLCICGDGSKVSVCSGARIIGD